MGTNFYARYNKCDCCNRFDELHLGKNSAGWKFLIHAHKEKAIISFSKLVDWIKKNKAFIYNEYDEEIALEYLIDLIKKSTANNKNSHYQLVNREKDPIVLHFKEQYFIDNEGYELCSGDFC